MTEKKEIGKLLELLNEYEEKRIEKINSEGKLIFKLSFNPYTEESLTNEAYRSCWLEICSKYYGFIKWLVDNDKIDFENMEGHGRLIGYLTDNMEKPTRDKVKEELVIMLLSISDTPIDLLCSLLK